MKIIKCVSSIIDVTKIYLMLLLLSFFSLLIFTGCEKAEMVQEEVEEDGSVQIGICFDSYLIERWERDRDVFVSTAKEMGAVVNVQNANGDPEEQIKKIQYFIDKKMDVIVIIGVDCDGLSDIVQKAKNQGIKVIAYDRMINNANVDLYISFDNEAVGTLMGEELVKNPLENGKVLMISGPDSDTNVTHVNEGFQSVMKENQIEIVDMIQCEGWRPEYASEYINEHGDLLNEIDAVMCGNDSIATQVVYALSEKRKAGKILVTGQDAELVACQRIVEGTQLMTVYKPVEKEAKKAAECAILLAKGEDIPDSMDILSNGKYEVPSIILTPISVVKDNMDETIVESGFHLAEEIYLNVSR